MFLRHASAASMCAIPIMLINCQLPWDQQLFAWQSPGDKISWQPQPFVYRASCEWHSINCCTLSENYTLPLHRQLSTLSSDAVCENGHLIYIGEQQVTFPCLSRQRINFLWDVILAASSHNTAYEMGEPSDSRKDSIISLWCSRIDSDIPHELKRHNHFVWNCNKNTFTEGLCIASENAVKKIGRLLLNEIMPILYWH